MLAKLLDFTGMIDLDEGLDPITSEFLDMDGASRQSPQKPFCCSFVHVHIKHTCWNKCLLVNIKENRCLRLHKLYYSVGYLFIELLVTAINIVYEFQIYCVRTRNLYEIVYNNVSAVLFN